MTLFLLHLILLPYLLQKMTNLLFSVFLPECNTHLQHSFLHNCPVTDYCFPESLLYYSCLQLCHYFPVHNNPADNNTLLPHWCRWNLSQNSCRLRLYIIPYHSGNNKSHLLPPVRTLHMHPHRRILPYSGSCHTDYCRNIPDYSHSY